MGVRTREALRRERMETTLSVLVELFITTKQTEGRSANTISWYRRMLGRFVEHAGDIPLRELSVETARAFVASLQAQAERWQDHPYKKAEEGGLSGNTVQAYVRALKAFSAWLQEEGYTPTDRFEKLKRPKVGKAVIEILSEEEIRRIYACINPNCFLGARLHTVISLLLDTGMRAEELCTLKLKDVHLEEGYLKVHGKGDKERIVPLGATTKKSVLRYLSTWRQPAHEGVTELVVSDEGTALTYSGLKQMIKRLGVRASVPRLRPHLFRHSFAVNYLMAGGDLRSLQLILGHERISTTEIYLRLADQHLAVQHARFSPLDRLGIAGKKLKKAV